MADPVLTPVIVQDADDEPRAHARVRGRGGAAPNARDRRGVVLEPLARGALAQGRDVGQHARGRGDPRRLRRGRASLPRASERPGLPHRRGVVLRAVALARRRRAGGDATARGRTSPACSRAGRLPPPARSGRRGSRRRSPASASPTSGSSRSSPTSGSTATSCSQPAGCSRRPSRTSFGDGTPAPDVGSATIVAPHRRRDRNRLRRAPRAARAAARARRGSRAVGLCRLRPELRPVPDALLVPRDRAAGRVRRERERRDGGVRAPSSRSPASQAETSFDRVESYPEYPGVEHPMRILARLLDDMGVTGTIGADQDGYPGILGYQGPSLAEVTGAEIVPLAAAARAADGPQERGRDRADPRERALVRARAPAAAGVHAAGRDRGAGEPARRLRGEPRDARRRSARRTTAASRRRTAPPPATAARSASGARGRTRSRTTSSSSPATCSSARRARPSGATTPSSSARWSSARRPTRCDAISSTCARRSRSPSTRCDPA